ncbi:polyketide synthase dehydratase domain-containing protein [Streptomyces nogalater]
MHGRLTRRHRWPRLPRVRRPRRRRPWTTHATGVLRPAGEQPAPDTAAWPPPGAEPVGLDGLYERLAELGAAYGPGFQGLRAAWRHGEEVCAEVAVPGTAGFGLHPALSDAALHALALRAGTEERMALPFAWNGVELYAPGATALRVRIAPPAGAVRVEAADASGRPVARVASLALREVDPERIAAAAAGGHDDLFAPDWVPVAVPAAPQAGRWTVCGPGREELAAALAGEVAEVTVAAGPAEAAAHAPGTVVLVHPGGADADTARAACGACSPRSGTGWPTTGPPTPPWWWRRAARRAPGSSPISVPAPRGA